MSRPALKRVDFKPKRKDDSKARDRARTERQLQYVGARASIPMDTRGYAMPDIRALACKITPPKYFDCHNYVALVSPLAGDTWAAATNVTPGGNGLSLPLQGTDQFKIEGRQCYIRGIRIKGLLYRETGFNSATTNAAELQANGPGASPIRIVLVQDTQTNTTMFDPNLLFKPKPVGTPAGGDIAFNYPQNIDHVGRFRVLKDKVKYIANDQYWFNNNGASIHRCFGSVAFKINVKFNKPILVKLKTSNGGTIADMQDNSFHLLCGDGGGTVTPATSLKYTSRVIFSEE